MKRAAFRWARRLLVLGACVAVLSATVHTPWVRGLVLSRITARLSARSAFVYSASALEYNLFRLRVGVANLQISRREGTGPPLLRVRRADAILSPKVFTGVIEVNRLEADGVTLVVDIPPASDTHADSGSPFSVPAFSLATAVVRNLDVDVINPDGIGHLRLRDASIEIAGGGHRRFTAPFVVAGGVTLDGAHTRVRLGRIEGRAYLDGDVIGVSPTFAVAGSERLAFDGGVTLTGPSPHYDLGIAGGLDVAHITGWFPDLPAGTGQLQLTGRVTGPLTEPDFRYSARTDGVSLPDIRVPAAVAEGSVSRAGVFIDRMRTVIGGGRVEATGRLPLGSGDLSSRFSLKWSDVALAGLSKVFARLPADPIGMVAAGSARLSWPGAALEVGALEGGLESEVRFAPSLRPARVALDAAPGHWTLRSDQMLDGDTAASLEAAIAISSADVTKSQLSGTLRASSADIVPALAEVRRAFPSLPDVSQGIAGSPLTIETAVNGTLRTPRFTGTATSERLRVEGLPAMRVSADFEATASGVVVSKASGTDGSGNRFEGHAGVDFENGTTNGGVNVEVSRLESVLKALLGAGAKADESLKAGGSVVLAGEWNGPASDPALSLTVSAPAVSLSGTAFDVDAGSLEGRLSGPLSHPEGTLRVRAGAVRAASLAPVPVDAQISLASGRLEVAAQVPDWSATLSGHVSAKAPHDFTAAIEMADLTAARFMALLGVTDEGWSADGTLAARLDAAGTLDSRTLQVGGRASLSGGALRMAETRVIEGMNASIEIRGGRLWLTRAAGLGFNGQLSASGDLPLDWVDEYLPEGWRFDETSEKPASFALTAEPDVQRLGTWLRPEEPGRMSGALRLRASGTATAPSLGAVDGVVVIEPDSVTVRDAAFTLTKAAEVRIKDGVATADGVSLSAPGTTASLSGTVGLTGSQPVDATLSASGALGFLSSIIPGRVTGEFTTMLRATGTAADPVVSGNLSLNGAAWVWPEQRIALRDWSGSALLTKEAVSIEKLEGLVNGGDASISGSVRYRGGGTGVTLQVHDAFAEVIKGLRSQADAALTLASTEAGAQISGKVTVTSGAYREPITAMARLFTSRPESAAGRVSQASPLDAIALDVELAAASPIVIENSAGRLDLAPSMTLKGTLAEPVFFGTLDMVDDGRLTLLGRTFRLTEARVIFAGSGDPAVQIHGETRVGDYEVRLRTNGPVTRMETTYSSEPPLSERDLQSLLITGRTTETSGTKSSESEQFVLGTASSDLLGFAGQMVGLDTVQLGRADFELGSSDVDQAMRLTASKSISGRTRLILSQNLDDNKLTWIVVFMPRRGYEIRLSQRDNLEEVLEFRQEVSFGPGVSPPNTSGLRKRAKGPRITSVEFAGGLRTTASELMSVVKLKPPKTFDAGRWQEDRARLEEYYRNLGYATARIVPERTASKDGSVNEVRLRYRVDPGPRTILDVKGVELSDEERRQLMRVWSGSVVPEFLNDDLTGHLRALLASRGHLRPSISVTVATASESETRVNLAVTPGPLTSARRLVIEGAHAIPEPDLRAALSENPALETMWVDPAPLVEAVTAVYAQHGYPSARVVADDLAFEGEVAERRLRLTEGPQAVVSDVALTGVADARVDGAKTAVALRTGQPLLPGMETDARRRLERFYLDRGFRSASVRSSTAADRGGRVALSFTVAEGPVAVVNAIAITGLDATKPGVVDGAVMLKAGDPAGQAEAAETQKRLYGLGVFRNANVTFEPAEGPPRGDAPSTPVTMTVSLEEARRFQLRYGVQLSNEYGPVFDDITSAVGVAADLRDRNFLGRAFALGVSGRLEKNLRSLRGQFALPPLLGQRLQTSFFSTIRSETDTTPDESVIITDKERDVTFEQRLRLPYRMEVSWGYSYNLRDLLLVAPLIAESIELTGTLATLNGTFILDARDKAFNASRGWFQSTNAQWGLKGLGSDFNFVRLLLRQFYYRPVGPLVLASGVRWGWLHGISGVPPITIFDRYFDAGGSQTVRGYAEESLSAVYILSAPAGGTKLLLLNQEARFPLFSKWLQGAVFIDAGNTFAPREPLKLSELAAGTGFGLRIMTPFAPIRIDVGYPLNRRPQDRPYRVYFSIGQIF